MIIGQCRACWLMLEGQPEILNHKCSGSPKKEIVRLQTALTASQARVEELEGELRSLAVDVQFGVYSKTKIRELVQSAHEITLKYVDSKTDLCATTPPAESDKP